MSFELTPITIDGEALKRCLDKLAAAGEDLTPAMRKMSQTLDSIAGQNFIAEGNPPWEPLSETTKFLRLGGKKAFGKNGKLKKSAEKKKEKGFRILQQSGSMASSVTTRYDATSVAIGTNKVQGRIQQKGGRTGRGLKVKIPARPYLPVTADDRLQPEAERGLMETLDGHFKSAVSP